jgi:hypothetical protein
MTNTRRPATSEDLIVGAHVFKGNGKVTYKVWAVESYQVGDRVSHKAQLTKVDAVKAGKFYTHISEITVEA